jgi:hypothetical protein
MQTEPDRKDVLPAKHSQGPWTLGSEQGVTGPTASPAVYWPREVKWCEVTKGSEVIAYVARSGELTDEQHANARLIVSAPTLLAHLEFAVKLLGAMPALSGTAQVEAMRAAIAKATGEQA